MKKIYYLLILTSFLFGKIKNYHSLNFCIQKDGLEYRVLRGFDDKNTSSLLVVDTSSLESSIFSKNSNFQEVNCTKESYYQRLLDISSWPPFPLENDGITGAKSGIFITTDLCPSSKRGFEGRLYKSLIKQFKNPAPLTLFITKRWIRRHKREFNRLKKWDRDGLLKITWGNHTAYHRYRKRVPYRRNFVLLPRENLTKDIFDLEIELLKNGVTPSVFFRFPGLVSDKKSVELVKSLGLIIIGSNGWLAKGEKIKDGSIILVHGNRNEPDGVRLLLRAIKRGKIREIKSLERLEVE